MTNRFPFLGVILTIFRYIWRHSQLIFAIRSLRSTFTNETPGNTPVYFVNCTPGNSRFVDSLCTIFYDLRLSLICDDLIKSLSLPIPNLGFVAKTVLFSFCYLSYSEHSIPNIVIRFRSFCEQKYREKYFLRNIWLVPI
jgi:hypothetical protein